MRKIALVALTLFSLFGPSAHAGYPRDELDATQTETERKVAAIRAQEIQQVRLALGRRLPEQRQAELYYRLAELYLEGYRAEFVLEGRVHEKRISKNQETAQTKIDRGTSTLYLKYGIQSCEELVKLNIQIPQLDRVYFYLAVHSGELGDEAKSAKYYRELITKFPKSPFVAESYRELGDRAFARGDFEKARQYYLQALHLGRNLPNATELMARVMHKLAWTHYRTRDLDKAITVLKQSIQNAIASGEKYVSLKEEALRDMAVFMAEKAETQGDDAAEEAIAYFQSVVASQGELPKLLESLGRSYERQLQFRKAALVYGLILRSSPDDDWKFRTEAKLIELSLREGQIEQGLERAKTVAIPKALSQEGQNAYIALKVLIRKTGTDFHKVGQDKKQQLALMRAERAYEIYLARFLPEIDSGSGEVSSAEVTGESTEIKMYLAEVKRDLGRYVEAAKLYREVVTTRSPKFAKDAAREWLSSLALAFKTHKAPKSTTPSDISQLERDYVAAADEVAGLMPGESIVFVVALKAAQVLAGYTSTKSDAKARCKRIVETGVGKGTGPARSDEAATAALLWLQIISDDPSARTGIEAKKAQMAELVAAMEVIEKAGIVSKQLADALDQRKRDLRLGQIMVAESNKDFKAAAQGYEAIGLGAQTQNRPEIANPALASAFGAYLKAKDLDAADRILLAWRTQVPQERRDRTSDLATHAFVRGQYGLSAAKFEWVASDLHAADLNGATSYYLTAARIYFGDGALPKARALLLKVLNKLPPKRVTDAAREEAQLLYIETFKREEDPRLLQDAYRKCYESSPLVGLRSKCGALYGDLLEAKGQGQKAKKIFTAVAKLAVPKGEIDSYIGYAKYKEALAFELAHPPTFKKADLQTALDQKLKEFERIQEAYSDTIKSGGPWGIAATDRIAHWAISFADEIDSVPPAPGSSQAVAKQYAKTLSQMSNPIRKKAILLWAQAYRTSLKSQILSPMVPRLLDHALELASDKERLGWIRQASLPIGVQGVRGKLRIVGIPADGGREGREYSIQRVRDLLSDQLKKPEAWIDYGNLLWGIGKHHLSRIAYDRAQELDPKSVAALNNRAVILVLGSINAEEDWATVAEAKGLLTSATRRDSKFLAARMNLAFLLGYYRLFHAAAPLWEQVVERAPSVDGIDGLAIAVLGQARSQAQSEKFDRAWALFDRATSMATGGGSGERRFAFVYHQASKDAVLTFDSDVDGAKRCESRLDDLQEVALQGFEKAAAEVLRKVCRKWKSY